MPEVVNGNNILLGRGKIYFDRFDANIGGAETAPLAGLIPPDSPFAVLGSVRQPEEPDVLRLIADLLDRRPGTVIGLFPRHLHRVDRWRELLSRRSIPWALRSGLKEAAQAGQVIVWDVFGELSGAYAQADAAFVGGSLAPLGGQNFLVGGLKLFRLNLEFFQAPLQLSIFNQ